MSVLYGTDKQKQDTSWKDRAPLSANQSSSLDSDAALLPAAVTWNLPKDIYGNIRGHLLSTIRVSGRFWEEPWEVIREGDYWNIYRNVKKQTVFFQNKP